MMHIDQVRSVIKDRLIQGEKIFGDKLSQSMLNRTSEEYFGNTQIITVKYLFKSKISRNTRN